MSDKLWKRDDIQFPRLLSEIDANVMITPGDFEALCASMDLTKDEVHELFDRAHEAWAKAKAKNCPLPKRRKR